MLQRGGGCLTALLFPCSLYAVKAEPVRGRELVLPASKGRRFCRWPFDFVQWGTPVASVGSKEQRTQHAQAGWKACTAKARIGGPRE